MMANSGNIWLVILGLGFGTFLIRFSFLGIIGGRQLPEWCLRHLRYVATAVLPGLIAPLVLWPDATNGETDPSRLVAAVVAFFIGYRFNSVVGAAIGGMLSLYAMQYLISP
ncbi:MAG: branched-subunit amino acid transport protein [Gammaproteobacteria bacterium]|jgi:branched-subunit amino acid transport protein